MIPTKRPFLLNKIILMSLGILVIVLGGVFLLLTYMSEPGDGSQAYASYQEYPQDSLLPMAIVTQRDILIGDYFEYIDSLVSDWQPRLNYTLTEHLLVHANPWIMDTLANTDYYRMMERDSFVYDQKKLHVLRAGDSLRIPRQEEGVRLQKYLEGLWLDINIPEYLFRIYWVDSLLFEFPIRVGQNRKRYLAMGNRLTDLRTISGEGTIVRHAKDPDFYNPVNHQPFYTTKRDDRKRTMMPQIPWIETEIDGIRNGQMIHPTTNPETLGKAYSNGCIGTREADGWIIYYHAPLGTPIHIRYDLNPTGKEALEDIYGLE